MVAVLRAYCAVSFAYVASSRVGSWGQMQSLGGGALPFAHAADMYVRVQACAPVCSCPHGCGAQGQVLGCSKVWRWVHVL